VRRRATRLSAVASAEESHFPMLRVCRLPTGRNRLSKTGAPGEKAQHDGFCLRQVRDAQTPRYHQTPLVRDLHPGRARRDAGLAR
jgi:hypothetical protein